MELKIREAVPDDAEQLIALVNRISAEPDSNLLLSPGEFKLTVEEERVVLNNYAASDNSVFFVAEIDDSIVGELTLQGGHRLANRHAAELGMAIDRAWRDQGIGSELMTRAISWAKGTGVLFRIELVVFERNARAIHLYQKNGFTLEGHRRKVAYRNGEFIDDLIMALIW
jgi:RimJ/RimL family protein N-acetyltransferase